MKQAIDPHQTPRGHAFDLWMSSPMPMVTLTKTFEVGHVRRLAKCKNVKFNMLMCHCITKTAVANRHFYLLPENGQLYRYDKIAVNVIVKNAEGGINSCDIPYSNDLGQFNRDYLDRTRRCSEECQSLFLEDCMIVGTSTLVDSEIDNIVNQYSDRFHNPLLAWGRYRHHLFRTTLPISLQFHHVQMDGADGAAFLKQLQQTFNKLSFK